MEAEGGGKLVAEGGTIKANSNKIIPSTLTLGEDELVKVSEVSTSELIRLIEVLGNGYIKPDVRTGSSLGGVRDTKRYFPIIEECFREILKRIGLDNTAILAVIFNTKTKNHE